MQMRYFKTLAAVLEQGSFSRAAQVLHITQSAVSQRVKYVEEHYGHQLLDRSGPSLTATAAGQLVLAAAREILEKERALAEELKRLRGEKRLSLCCTPTFGMAYLPGVINDFIRRHSDMADLKFIFHQVGQAVQGLQDGEFDLAVLEHCGDLDLDTFQARELPQDELVFVSAPDLGLPDGEVALKELVGQRLYARKDGCSSKRMLARNLASMGHDIENFKSVVVSDDLRLTCEAVMGGGGIAYVSRSLVAERLEDGSLRAHRVKGFDHLRRRTILCHPDRLDEPVLESFIDCIYDAVLPRDGGCRGVA